jgi:DNA-binding CsgD family transcriptional regulator
LNLGPVRIDRGRVLPPVLLPLVHAAERGFDLISEIESITRHFGFDSFMYGVALSPRPDHESRIYAFTTLPLEWVMRYDQMAYVEIDPRVSGCWDRTVPLLWDQTTTRGKSARVDAFLDDALAHGIGSGVCLPSHDGVEAHILVVFNSATPILTKSRQQQIASNLGEMVMFANYFHDLFMKAVVTKGMAPKTAGLRLSPRERECLRLAAHGLTTGAISKKLGIADRTVQFHFASIRSKLMAANRQEAIARAIKDGQITV